MRDTSEQHGAADALSEHRTDVRNSIARLLDAGADKRLGHTMIQLGATFRAHGQQRMMTLLGVTASVNTDRFAIACPATARALAADWIDEVDALNESQHPGIFS